MTKSQRNDLEIRRLLQQYRETGNAEFRDRIVERTWYIADILTKRFSIPGHEGDVLTEGMLGLLNAIDLFDPNAGTRFTTYATHLVRGSIRHHLRDFGRTIRIPAWVQEAHSGIVKTRERLEIELGHEPTAKDIAKRLEKTENQVLYIIERYEKSSHPLSLDQPEYQNPEDDTHGSIIEKLDDPHAVFDGHVHTRLEVEKAAERLNSKERTALHHFFYEGLNQTETARAMGISVNYASYLIRGALSKIYDYIEKTREPPNPMRRTTVYVKPRVDAYVKNLYRRLGTLDDRLVTLTTDLLGSEPTGRELLCLERLEHFLIRLTPDDLHTFCDVYSALAGDDQRKEDFLRALYPLNESKDLITTARRFLPEIAEPHVTQ